MLIWFRVTGRVNTTYALNVKVIARDKNAFTIRPTLTFLSCFPKQDFSELKKTI